MAPTDFERFFRSEYDRLFRTVYLVVGDRAEAEDIAQEAMARAYERWSRVQAADSPTSYVYRIAFNLHRSALRRAGARLRAIARDRAEGHLVQEEEAAIVERRIDALRALALLPMTQRQALILVEWVGMTAEEAGRCLGTSAGSVRTRVHRARTTLRRRFGGNEDG